MLTSKTCSIFPEFGSRANTFTRLTTRESSDELGADESLGSQMLLELLLLSARPGEVAREGLWVWIKNSLFGLTKSVVPTPLVDKRGSELGTLDRLLLLKPMCALAWGPGNPGRS